MGRPGRPKVVWSVKVTEEEKEFLNNEIAGIKQSMGLNSNSEALLYIVKEGDRISAGDDGPQPMIPEVVEVQNRDLESICEASFLKYGNLDRRYAQWYCLRNMGKGGRQIPLGNDREFVRVQCESCHTGMALSRQYTLIEERTKAIVELGEHEVSVALHACTNYVPPQNAPQVQMGESNQFFCRIRRRAVTIKKVCMRDNCECLISQVFKLPLSTTEGYKGFKKALEDPK